MELNLSKLSRQIKTLTTEKLLKQSLGSEEILKKVEEAQKIQWNDGEDALGQILGVYSPVTELIAKNPQKYGVSNPIKPKRAGEPYNLQWSGNLFKTIKAEYYRNATIRIEAEGEYLDENPQKKVLGIQEQNRKDIERRAEQIAVKNIMEVISKGNNAI